ncbi:MAG: hypothetical protein AAGF60_02915 [Pseudomonadota bacterium]
MARAWIILLACGMLAACGNPLAGVERISDVTLAEGEAVPAALPSAEEVSNPEPVLGRLIEEAQVPEASAVPEAEIPAPEARPRGLLSRVWATVRPEPEPVPAPAPDLPVDAPAAAPEETPSLADADADPATEVAEPVDPDPATDVAAADRPASELPPVAEDAPARTGLFGLFRRPAPSGEETRTASLSPQPSGPAPAGIAPGAERGSRFGTRQNRPARRGADTRDVTYGTVLPYGQIARVCDAKRQPLGRKMDKAPRTRGFTLYDSNPDSEGPRTWYVTGFSDGCPRQFTAALAVFGSPSMHEQLRYGRPATEYPYSDTDQAYERIKSRICGVGKRKPCGSRIGTLERNTIFISTYERFGDNARWADVLLHDGEVMAKVIKTP